MSKFLVHCDVFELKWFCIHFMHNPIVKKDLANLLDALT